MVLLAVLIISALIAYWGMTVGVHAVLGRCLMTALAVSAGVGFAGPLRNSIPSGSPYLYGPCLLAVAVIAYLLQRTLADYCLAEPELELPGFIDRLGGAVVGFAFGLMWLSFGTLVLANLPLPASVPDMSDELRQTSRVAVGAARCVGVFAGTGQAITLEGVLSPD